MIEEAARSRRRTAAWTHHGATDAGLAGVLLDLAEHGADVTVSLTNDRSHRGVVLTVASTWVMMRTTVDARVLIRLRSIATIGCTGYRASFGERCAPITLGFAPMLERTVELGDQLSIWCGQHRLSGELIGLGDELAILAIDYATLRYVSIETIDEVVASGISARA
jgi:hypothetical protein